MLGGLDYKSIGTRVKAWLSALANVPSAKGDLWTSDGTLNQKLAIGADGKALTADSTQSTGLNWGVIPPSGAIVDFGGSAAPSGWLECDGSAVSRATYSALFAAISTTWGAGDGATTFNLPDFRGLTRVGKGTGASTASGVNADVDTTADTLAVSSNTTKWITGMPVVFTLSSGTITGLTSGNTYYVIRNSSTTVKLASSLANAQNGTAIDLTAKASPVWTITYTRSTRALGELGGEEGHAQKLAELLPHSHDGVVAVPGAGNGGLAAGATVGSGTTNATTGSGNNAMNIMQPFGVVMTIIKT